MEDQQIVNLCFERQESALEAAREKYGRLCTAVVRNVLRDDRDTEECVNDVWLRMWNAIPPERPQSLKAWLAKIARNLALDKVEYNQAEKRKSSLTEAYEELEFCLSADGAVENAAERMEFREFLNNFLAAQSKDNRIIFVRRYWYGEDVREIAKAMHCGEEKVKSSLFRTRNKMKAEMERIGVSV